jgi:hypothetical protein
MRSFILFMRRDIPYHLGTRSSEIRTRATDEIVFDHPLHKGFVHNRGGVGTSSQLGNADQVSRCGGRCDPVDHRAGELALGLDPVRQCRVQPTCKVHHQTAHKPSVLGKVVTGQDGKGCRTRRATTLQRADQKPNRGHWHILGQIALNVGMIDVQRTGRRVVAIPLFGDRQRDDPDLWFRHRSQHRLGVFGRDKHVIQNGDPACLFTLGRQSDRGIPPVLPLQRIARVRAAQGYAHDAPVPP